MNKNYITRIHDTFDYFNYNTPTTRLRPIENIGFTQKTLKQNTLLARVMITRNFIENGRSSKPNIVFNYRLGNTATET